MLICLIGIDGSGKTTHALELYRLLQSRGYACKYYHLTFYTLTKIIPHPLRSRFSKSIETPQGTTDRSASETHSKFSYIKYFFLMLFTLIDNWLTYVAYLRRNYVIICDRYFYHYVFPLNRVGGISRYLLEIYPRLIPKPDIVFLLDLPAEMAHERRPEAPISTYRRNREYYLKLAKQLNFIVINTSDQFTKVSSLVVNKVLSLLER